MISLLGLDPATWTAHPLHAAEREFTETNCWTDVMVELVAAAGGEPTAMLGHTAALDFETDQWTFFKPPAEDLRRLYGLDVHEVQPHRPLDVALAERLAEGRTLVPELDAFHLPDTATTSYRAEHVKTSVVVEAIDLDAQELRYFHNAGYFALDGEDYRAVLRLDDPAGLPPYTEQVRLDAGPRLTGEPLRAAAGDLLREHLARRPADNPVVRFGTRLESDLPGLLEGDLATYHAYAFATARMAGAGFGLLATHVRWLLGEDGEEAAADLDDVVGGAKMLSFRLARRRAFDVAGVVGPMADAWARATDRLDAVVGPSVSRA